MAEMEVYVFKFTLPIARSHGFEFGIEHDDQLVVQRVIPHSAISSWNALSYDFGSPQGPENAVKVGDQITCVNGLNDSEGMVKEMAVARLVSITIARLRPVLVPVTSKWLWPQLQ